MAMRSMPIDSNRPEAFGCGEQDTNGARWSLTGLGTGSFNSARWRWPGAEVEL